MLPQQLVVLIINKRICITLIRINPELRRSIPVNIAFITVEMIRCNIGNHGNIRPEGKASLQLVTAQLNYSNITFCHILHQ